MKTVLITGISRGIGASLADKFLSEGWFVLGTIYKGSADFERENLKTFKLDLSSTEKIKKCTEELKDLGQEVDVLINNAGVLLDEEETQVISDKLRETLEINLIGTIDFTEKVLPLIKQGGHIVNTSSSAGSLDGVGHSSHFEGHYPAYKISKCAINMYTRTLAYRLKGKITVSSIHPGWVKTDMGGEEADTTPAEAAKNIYDFAISNPKSGEFWHGSQRMPW